MSHSETVKVEVDRLCTYFLPKLGEVQEDGRLGCAYGKLFDDEEGQQYFEAIMGTLKAAKKQNLVEFKGQMLLKGAHDDVVIFLVSSGKGEEKELSPSSPSSSDAPIISNLECTTDIHLEESTVRSDTQITTNDERQTSGDVEFDPCAGNLHVFEQLMKNDLVPASEACETGDAQTYSLDELKSPGPYPNDVDPSDRESYLFPAEFVKLFKMSLKDFKSLPKWKRDTMKKGHQLF